ncbi:MAG: hypothetical protein Q8N60_00220 [Candidatus Diapherotrites archaeon]|nr:hypothetical protein [Candidatus Diapherotrites archaeon]
MSPVLHGGRKPVRVLRVKQYNKLGGNDEGRVFAVNVTVKRKGRKRTIKLAEKVFHKGHLRVSPLLPFGIPSLQFEIMSELKRLNVKKKLGLHILPTIRLRKIKGKKPRLVLTRWKKIEWWRLSEKQQGEVLAQRGKEQKILEENGYDVLKDAWRLIEAPFTREPTFILWTLAM